MRTKLLATIFGLLCSVQAGAVTLPNTFTAGDPAVAAEVNDNFATLEAAINAQGATAFSDYFLKPSSTGALGTRNVIVWEISDFDPTCYIARGWFDNTNTEISVANATTTVTPDEIFVWRWLCGDSTTVTQEGEYVYALPSLSDGSQPSGLNGDSWTQAQGISINWDGNGDQIFEDTGNFGYEQRSTRNPAATVDLVVGEEYYFDASGDVIRVSGWSRALRRLNRSITVNGMTFNDVVVGNFATSNQSPERIRLYAKDIGPILESFGGDPVFPNQFTRGVIFYRIEGTGTAGSLAGTPFESTDRANVWFQP